MINETIHILYKYCFNTNYLNLFPLQKDTKQKIDSVVQELCAEDCKLELYQEDNSDEILVSGKYVEGQ